MVNGSKTEKNTKDFSEMISIPPLISIGKKSLYKLPLIGPLYFKIGNIPVDRTDLTQAMKALDEAAMMVMTKGYSIAIAPEGKRRRSPSVGPEHLLPFKKGPFHIISRLWPHVSVVPVVVYGSYRAWPPGSMCPLPGSKVTVRFGRPVDFSSALTAGILPLREPTSGPRSPITTDEVLPEGTSSNAVIDAMIEICRKTFEKEMYEGSGNGKYDADAAFERGSEVSWLLLWGIILIFSSPVLVFVWLMLR
jgi:1-acyl-sn-glycerol-3-phosphate acyltransferase